MRYLAFLLAFITVAFSGSVPEPPAATINFPIQVYNEDGLSLYTATRVFQVSNASGIDSVYVKAHQPFYHIGGNLTQCVINCDTPGFDNEGAAEIRINGGNWIEIRDSNVDTAWPERNVGGVAGMFATIRFTFPASGAGSSGAIVAGANTVDFRFNGTDGIRSGWRVLDFGFMTSADPTVQDFSGFAGDGRITDTFAVDYDNGDPGGDPVAGAALWNQNGILKDLTGANTQAACSDCHFDDASDLKYFRYGNREIIARSEAHGLTLGQATDIASYVHSVDLLTEGGSGYNPPGWPWAPLYQPGLGYGPNQNQSADDVNQVYWMAGAGLDWVTDGEREGRAGPNYCKDALAHFFPKDGNCANGVDVLPNGELNWHHLVFGWEDESGNLSYKGLTGSTFNIRDMPINIQLSDWNNWLPDIHPMDADDNRFVGSATEAWYEDEIRGGISGSTQDAADVLNQFFKYGDKDNTCPEDCSQDGTGDRLMNLSFGAYDTEFEGATVQQSFYQWMLVKTTEAVRVNYLEDKADDIYTAGPNKDQGYDQPRGWPIGTARTPFEVAPHVADNQNSPGNTNPYSYYINPSGDNWFSHTWYHYQAILMPYGDENSSGQQPMDWGYQDRFLNSSCFSFDDLSCWYRFMSSMLVQYRGSANSWGVDGFGNDGNFGNNGGNATKRGWSANKSDWDRLWIMARAPDGAGTGSALGIDEKTDIIEAFLRAYLDFILTQPIAEIPVPSGSWGAYQFEPPCNGFGLGDNVGKKDFDKKWYNGLRDIGDNYPGINPGLIDSLAAWGDAMWPDDQAGNTISINAPAFNSGTNRPATCGNWGGKERWHQLSAGMTNDDPCEVNGNCSTPSTGSGGPPPPTATNPPVQVGTAAWTAADGLISGGAVISSGTNVELRCRGIDDDGAGLTQADFIVNGVTIHTDNSPGSINPISTHTFSPADGDVTVQCVVSDNEGTTPGNEFTFTVGGAAPPPDTLNFFVPAHEFAPINNNDPTCFNDADQDNDIVRVRSRNKCHLGKPISTGEFGTVEISTSIDSLYAPQDSVGATGWGIISVRAGNRDTTTAGKSEIGVLIRAMTEDYSYALLDPFTIDAAGDTTFTRRPASPLLTNAGGSLTFTQDWVSASEQQWSMSYTSPSTTHNFIVDYSVDWEAAHSSFGVDAKCNPPWATNCSVEMVSDSFDERELIDPSQ